MWRSFCYLYIQLKVTKLYEIKLTIFVCYTIFLQIDRCSEIILATAKNKFRIICIEVTICPVCRWCIFRLPLSFTDFISSISERLTAVPKFHNFFFLLSRFQSSFISSDFASISYHLITALRLRSPISYCKTKNMAHVFVFAKGIHTRC